MNISTCIRPSHDAALLDAARVACLLVSEPDDSCHRDTPENCDRSRNVLFAASATLDGGQTRLDALAEHYRCDAVDVIREADGGFHFRMGYRLFWKVLWHDHDYRLWRPRNGTAACFVSAGPTHDMWFRMEGYRLRPGIDDRPWADQQERLLGLYLGAAALQRLAGGADHGTVKKFAAKATFAKTPSELDPLSWLYLNPTAYGFKGESGFAYGVLRRAFRGRANSAGEFCRRKAQPVAPLGDAAAIPWPITAERIEVLLPPDADDRFLDPHVLCEEVDRRAVKGEQELLTHVSLAFPTARRLHECWESARAFARSSFVKQRGLAVILILHVPHRAGSDNDAHCHLLMVPRRMDGPGLRGFAPDLCRDTGQAIVHAAWPAHKAAWQA